MSEWALIYPTEPSAWDDAAPRQFRCGYCGRMVCNGDGKWVVRQPYVGPGQFMAVHRKGVPKVVAAVTYNRDDDRYYRKELQALQDNIEDTNSLLSELLFRLRDDDDLRTYEARVKITAARTALHTAAASVELAFRRLPAPTTELAR